MLDNDHCISLVYQFFQDNQQLADVFAVEAGGGFVQDIQRVSAAAAHEFCRQFHALRLAAGHGGGGLAQVDIAQPHFLKGLEFAQNFIMVRKEGHRFIDGHIEHIGNIFSFVPHFQGFPVVPRAVAHFAGHVDIRKKLHFYLDDAIAVASLAAAAFHIETEATRFVAPHFRLRGLAVKFANIIEYTGIGGRIRPGRAADGLLIDVDDLIHVLHAFHGIILAGTVGGVIFDIAQSLVQNFIDQGTFPRARFAGDYGESAQRNGHIDVFQIVFRCPFDGEEKAISFSPLRRKGDIFLAAKVHAGDRVFHLLHVLRRSFCHHAAAVFAGAGADVHHPIGGANGVFVMLHHDQRIS